VKTRTRIALVLASILSVGAARQLVAGERAIAQSDLMASRGDAREAIAYARVAAESLLPGSPYPERGYARLERIAMEAEARGDSRTAAASWGAMRAAVLETRALGSGREARLGQANAGLARAAAGDVPNVQDLAERLERNDIPSPWELLLLAAISLAFYVAGAHFLRPRSKTTSKPE
jgi:hypothetical protein